MSAVREVKVAIVDRSDLAGESWAVIDDRGTLWAAVAPDAEADALAAVNEALQHFGADGLDRSGCSAIFDLRRHVQPV